MIPVFLLSEAGVGREKFRSAGGRIWDQCSAMRAVIRVCMRGPGDQSSAMRAVVRVSRRGPVQCNEGSDQS